MSNPQETETKTADAVSTPVASSEQKGIAAVSDALKSVFGDLKPEGTPAPAESKNDSKSDDAAPDGGDDGLSAAEIDELLKGLEEPAKKDEKADDAKPDDKKGETETDPFAKIEENWDSDVAKVMRDQAAKIDALEKRLAATPESKQTAGGEALGKNIGRQFGSE